MKGTHFEEKSMNNSEIEEACCESNLCFNIPIRLNSKHLHLHRITISIFDLFEFSESSLKIPGKYVLQQHSIFDKYEIFVF